MESEREVEEVIKQDELFFKNEEIFFQQKILLIEKQGNYSRIWSDPS